MHTLPFEAAAKVEIPSSFPNLSCTKYFKEVAINTLVIDFQ
jgi:hypothetical protein